MNTEETNPPSVVLSTARLNDKTLNGENMNNCKNCGSFAVNHHCHGRNGDDADLCDVCYWRKRADALREDAERYRWLRKAHDSTDSVTLWHVRGTGGQPIESGSLDADIDAAMRFNA